MSKLGEAPGHRSGRGSRRNPVAREKKIKASWTESAVVDSLQILEKPIASWSFLVDSWPMTHPQRRFSRS